MLKSFVKNVSYLKKESLVILAVIFGGGGYAVIHKNTNSSTRKSIHEENEEYIYLSSDKSRFNKGVIHQIFPSKILKLAKFKNKRIRHYAIKALSIYPGLDESQKHEIAQACNLQMAVGLARLESTPLEFFLPPPLMDDDIPKKKEVYEEIIQGKFHKLFQILPSDDSFLCAEYTTKYANQFLKKPSWNLEQSIYDDIDENLYYHQRNFHVSVTYMKLYLEAVLAHSTISKHRYLMVKSGVLQLLHNVRLHYQYSDEVCCLIGQIISNLSLEVKTHVHIFTSGWVGILASWMKSSSLQMVLPAVKALANMDRDYENIWFEDGIYLMHPMYRKRNTSINFDVVLIHGIMGGAFRTWRQHDSCNIDATKQKSKNVTKMNDPSIFQNDDTKYSFCWPKDWLAKDFPMLRLIAVDYHSHFLEWRTKCPVDKSKRDLKTRAQETLKKLVAAGVGNKPVIWITHSMGGLIAKQMLVDAHKSADLKTKRVSQNTVAVIFYSVPHLGSEVAQLKKGAEIILQPSIEAQLMKRDSPELLKLHKDFKKLAIGNKIKCLSFGETLKTKIGFQWNSVLVSKASADPGWGEFHELELDHLNTCKPKSPKSLNYKLLVSFLRQVLLENKIISQTWHGSTPEIFIIYGLIH